MEILRKYGVSTVVLFPLIDAGTNDFENTPVTFASGDTQVSKDEAAFANTTNNPTHEGNGIYSLTLTATEMQAARIVITVIDSVTKTWEDQAIVIATYGNAFAQHAFDLDNAQQPVDAMTIASGAISSAAIGTDAIGSSELAASAAEEIADIILRRTMANVEASSDGDAVSVGSLYGLIQMIQEFAISGTTLTVKKTDGATTLGTKTLTEDASANPVTGVA